MKRGMKAQNKVFVFVCAFLIFMVFGHTPKAEPAESKSTIKIGILYPLTGPEAQLGERQLRGWKLCFGEVNYEIDGHPVKFIVEDTQGNPRVGLTKVTKLVERDKVDVLGGVVHSGVGYAIRDFVVQARVPLVISMANAGGLTRQRRSPYIFRTFTPGGTGSYYMAQYLYRKLGLRTALFSGVDNPYGHEHSQMFKAEFERLGGKVLFANYAPYGTSDYAPYVAQLGEHKADVLHFVYSGADAIRFVKALYAYGLKRKMVMSNWGATNDGYPLKAMGKAAEGMYFISNYIYDFNNEANRRFLALDKKKGGRLWYDALDEAGYTAGQAVRTALKQVNGNVQDRKAFLNALHEAKWQSPSGPLWFDPQSQNALTNLVISQVKKVNGPIGEYQNKAIVVLKNVQDPWWLAHPEGK